MGERGEEGGQAACLTRPASCQLAASTRRARARRPRQASSLSSERTVDARHFFVSENLQQIQTRSLQLRLSAPEIVGCAFQLRLETQRHLKFGNAFSRFARDEQGQPQFAVSVGTVRIQSQRFVKLINSLRNSAQLRERGAKIHLNV